MHTNIKKGTPMHIKENRLKDWWGKKNCDPS